MSLLINGSGRWPDGLEHVALADRMGVTFRELEETPAEVVEDYRTVMGAEAEAAEIRNRWTTR